MSEVDDSDEGIELKGEELLDVAEDVSQVVKPEKLSRKESSSFAVVQLLNTSLKEAKRRIKHLEGEELKYINLKVDYAKLYERMRVCGKASVFWDLVLILSPLFIGLYVNERNFLHLDGAMVWVPLLILIVAALIARYSIPKVRKGDKERGVSNAS